jgi:hypothetical protein
MTTVIVDIVSVYQDDECAPTHYICELASVYPLEEAGVTLPGMDCSESNKFLVSNSYTIPTGPVELLWNYDRYPQLSYLNQV